MKWLHLEPEPQEKTMSPATRITTLRYALIATGVIFIFGIDTLAQAWPSVAHSLAMTVSVLQDTAERGHLIGDVPALLIVAGALTILTQRARRNEVVTPGIRWETRSVA
jgi:ABC-type sugar transport system substrate-binding protein